MDGIHPTAKAVGFLPRAPIKVSISPEDGEEEIDKMTQSVENYCEDVGVEKVVLFPFAHLFEELADAEEALELLDKLYSELQEKFQAVERVPFGWYKTYTIESTGHPLSAASREF